MCEEINKQYEKGLVDLMSIVEPLIDKFKADKNSIDIQQLQLVTEYLITDRELDENYIDELEVKLDKEKLNSLSLSEQLNKEKETSNLLQSRLDIANAKIIEYDKTLEKLQKDSVWKDKIKGIIYGDYEDLEIILKIKKLVEGE